MREAFAGYVQTWRSANNCLGVDLRLSRVLSRLYSIFSNALAPVIAGAAVVASGFSLQKYWNKSKDRFSMIWLCFTIGLFLWFIGESVWMGYTLVWNVGVPYPSIADVFWLCGYLPFFAALYLYVKVFSLALSRKMLIATMFVAVALSLTVSLVLITPVL